MAISMNNISIENLISHIHEFIASKLDNFDKYFEIKNYGDNTIYLNYIDTKYGPYCQIKLAFPEDILISYFYIEDINAQIDLILNSWCKTHISKTKKFKGMWTISIDNIGTMEYGYFTYAQARNQGVISLISKELNVTRERAIQIKTYDLNDDNIRIELHAEYIYYELIWNPKYNEQSQLTLFNY